MSRAAAGLVAAREIELKFHLPLGSRVVLEASAILGAAEPRRCHQVTTYYDTPDRVLNSAGMTLRVRRIGATHVQTAKSRADGRSIATVRTEFAWPLAHDRPDVGRLAEVPELASVAQSIRDRLEPVFVTDIHRTARLVDLAGAAVVELVIDEGHIIAGAACLPVSELELELKSGSIRPMYRLAAELQSLARMWISAESKSVRGWHLRTGQTEGARRSQTPDLGRRIRAADAFQEIIDLKLGHLVANIGPALSGDPEGVHQIRIALRGSRAALRLFAGHLDATAVRRFDEALKQFGLVFGAARDWDVFCYETLPRAMAEMPTERIWDLHAVAEVKRKATYVAMEDVLRGPDLALLVMSLAVWADTDVVQPATRGDGHMGKRMVRLAPALLDRAAGKARKCIHRAGLRSSDGLHRLRKSLKRLFYDVQDLSSLYGHRAVAAYSGPCESLGARLGVSIDSHVTQLLALKLASDNRPDLAGPLDALRHWSASRDGDARGSLRRLLREFRDAPIFWS